MNAPDSESEFMPKQALNPSPQLYDLLVGDSMEKLALSSVAQLPQIPPGSVFHDNGCGTGAATKAIIHVMSEIPVDDIHILASDINDDALDVYKDISAREGWPAQASRQDSLKLDMADNSLSHSVLNALLFTLPNDGVGAVAEASRTLKPGGILLTNSWHYVPNLEPIQTAARQTRPEGTPLPRQGMQKWEEPEFLRSVVEKGGFQSANIKLVKVPVYCTTTELTHFVTMLWSFIGGTGAAGWLTSDETNWDQAIKIIKDELQKTDGFRQLENGKVQLKFIANIAVAFK